MNKSLSLRELAFTGERLVTGQQHEHVQMIFEHLHRYYLAVDICAGRAVLDIACGEGYGSNLIAQKALSVIGVDNAPKVIRHAAAKYRRENLKFLTGDCLKIPLPPQSVDVVVSFETIEHISRHERFISEIKRVLRPGGILIISSPDKTEYSERYGQHNDHHVRELYRGEFLELLGRHFQNCLPMQQRLVGGSYIAADHFDKKVSFIYGTHRGDFHGGTFTEGVHEGVYCVAVCSDGQLPDLRLGMFENKLTSAHIWNAYETAPQRGVQAQELRDKLGALENQFRGREREWLGTNEALEREKEHILIELEAVRAELRQVKAKLDEANCEVDRRGVWGHRLDDELASIRQALVQRDELRRVHGPDFDPSKETSYAQVADRQDDAATLSERAAGNITEQLEAGGAIKQLEEKHRLRLEGGEGGAIGNSDIDAKFSAATNPHISEPSSFSQNQESKHHKLPERLKILETELADLRKSSELNEISANALRIEVEKKRICVVELTTQLESVNADLTRLSASWREEKEQLLHESAQSLQGQLKKIEQLEAQLLVVGGDLAAARAERQRSILAGINNEVERRKWLERVQVSETELVKQREWSELNEAKATALRVEAESKHAKVLDLMARLSFVEGERDRALVAGREEKEQLLERLKTADAKKEDESMRYEDQLAAAQTQLASAIADNNNLALACVANTAGGKSERMQIPALLQSDHDLREMKSSLSWRITSPLRRLNKLLGDPLCRLYR